jgi:predicted DNA-binding transcriptional regulator YafY
LNEATVTLSSGAPGADPEVLTALAAACRRNEQVRFDYTAHDGTTGRRRAEPHRLVHAGARWYLVAWDVDRADWRTFRVDRLRPRTPNGPRFTPREPPETGVAAATAYGITTGAYRYRGRFTLHVPVHVAADTIPPTVGVLEAVDEHSCTLRAGSDSLDELALYVGLSGHPFEVHEPPELVDRVRRLAGLLGAAVPAGPGDTADPGGSG